MQDKIQLLSMNGAELLRFVTEDVGESKFRAKQIREWLNRGADISEMTNLSGALRAKLAEMAVANPVRIRESYKSKLDGTEKFLYELPDGKVLNVLAEGRLVNLAGGNGHPAEIMDMSFAVQAMAAEWLVKHKADLECKMYDIPTEIDDMIAWTKLAALGLSIDVLTPEQTAYLESSEA